MRYLIAYDATRISKLAPAFPTPAFAKNAKSLPWAKSKGRGTHGVADAGEFKGWATRRGRAVLYRSRPHRLGL
jgi:hypothetical protein